jgi:hypothetical protein
MKNSFVFFSPSNPDSCMAAGLLYTEQNNEENCVKTIPYTRGITPFSIPEKADAIFIVGADLTNEDFAELTERNPDAMFEVSSYANATQYTSKILSPLVQKEKIKFNDCFIEGHMVSLTELKMFEMSHKGFFDKDELDHISNLSGILKKYIDFEMLTIDETHDFFTAARLIKKFAMSPWQFASRFLLNKDFFVRATQEDYNDYVQDIRSMIGTNLSMACYAGANGSAFMTPTICVPERDALQAMRFINYTYDEVISYEDTRYSRVYRILAGETNLKWYIRRFEPTDIWTEGKLTYLKTELPRHVR